MTSCQNTSPSRIHIFFMSLSRIVIGMNSFRCSEVVSTQSFVLGSYRRPFRRAVYTNWICGRYENEPNLSTRWQWVMTGLSTLDYTEVVEANYNKSIISLSEILQLFFENHDYSVVYPKRYASVIYYTEEEQREESEYYMKQYLVVSYARHELVRVEMLQQSWNLSRTILMLNTCTTNITYRILQQWCCSCCTSIIGIFERGSQSLTSFLLLQSRYMTFSFTCRLNACLSGFYDTEYVAKILDSINVPDNIKLECKLRASRALPQCILL